MIINLNFPFLSYRRGQQRKTEIVEIYQICGQEEQGIIADLYASFP